MYFSENRSKSARVRDLRLRVDPENVHPVPRRVPGRARRARGRQGLSSEFSGPRDRLRSAAQGLRHRLGNDAVEIKSGETSARIQLSDSSAFSGQELAVAADFAIKPGWHIYGKPLPKGYVATAINFDAAMVAQQSFDFPKPTPIRVAALGETLEAYTGEFKAIGKILLREKLAAGEHKLAGELKFQVCNDQICKLPQTVRFEIPIAIQPIKE